MESVKMKEMMLLCSACDGRSVVVGADYDEEGVIYGCGDCGANYCVYTKEESLYNALAIKEMSPITKEEMETVGFDEKFLKENPDIKTARMYIEKKTKQPIAWMLELSKDGETTQIYYTEANLVSEEPGE